MTERQTTAKSREVRNERTPASTPAPAALGDCIPTVNRYFYAYAARRWPKGEADVLAGLDALRDQAVRDAEGEQITKAERAHVVYGANKHVARAKGEAYLPPRLQAKAEEKSK